MRMPARAKRVAILSRHCFTTIAAFDAQVKCLGSICFITSRYLISSLRRARMKPDRTDIVITVWAILMPLAGVGVMYAIAPFVRTHVARGYVGVASMLALMFIWLVLLGWAAVRVSCERGTVEGRGLERGATCRFEPPRNPT
jgi:hypothetical protein